MSDVNGPISRRNRVMAEYVPTRDEAFSLLTEYNRAEGLINHALAVEAVMRHYARKYGADEERWGLVGLIHDLDYEQFPERHCHKSAEILRERGWPADLVRAVLSHGWGICTDVEPQETMEKVLYAVDELTGLVAATALVRPSGSVLDMTAKSVLKKFKDRAFAAKIDRDVISRGAEMLGVGLSELIAETIEGMKAAAAQIGLGMKGE
ncbi:MAG TPA: HDIG domain-containing protein [Anaerohalosphaeraceae bacterium]|jgi:putative nucleotidyltransferase with HDIG domain|nr:HDIG domain-containing protein [Anaerohalosphaeraceae bacterium]HRT51927.1 HDIG domain-containing protein [Anaerohalosphaeraceae bacterium]